MGNELALKINVENMPITFDNNPKVYFLIANTLFLLAAVVAVGVFIRPSLASKKIVIVPYIMLNILVMVLMRLPFIVFNQDIHPDESEITAGAMALGQNMTFWGQVDGMTSGPFNFYPLVIFSKLFAQPFDYTSSRIVGTMLLSGSLAFFFYTVQNLFSSKYAFVSLLFVASFLGIINSIDMLHYNSEWVSMCLINVLCWQFSCIYILPKPTNLLLFLNGFVAPITIFAKLQATPIGFCCILVSVAFLFVKYYKQSPQSFFRYTAIICLGCVCFLVLVCAFTLYNQTFDDMILLYFTNNLGYGSVGKFFIFDVNYFCKVLFEDTDYIVILQIFTTLIGLVLLSEIIRQVIQRGQRRAIEKVYWPTIFVISLVMFSVFSVFKTGFLFGHYLNFLIFPTGFVLVLLLNSVSKLLPDTLNKIIVAMVVSVVVFSNSHYPLTNSYISTTKPIRPLSVSATSKVISKYTKSNEPLAVWGSGSRFHLETKLVQATRWNFTLFDPYNKSQKAFLYNEYLKDMKRTNVPVFVDSYGNQERQCHGHEVVPEIRNWIKTNYTKVGDIDGSRIYVRNDRQRNTAKNGTISQRLD